MEEIKNKYYIRLNENGRIVKTFSNALENCLESDIQVGVGYGTQFRVKGEVLSAELQEFSNVENGLCLINDNGLFALKYENGLICKVTEEEQDAELQTLPKAPPTEVEILKEENLLLMETAVELYEKNIVLEQKTAVLEQQNLDIMEAIADIYENKI